MLDRWKKLHKDLYNAKTDKFDLSKVPDVHDNIRCVDRTRTPKTNTAVVSSFLNRPCCDWWAAEWVKPAGG